MVDFYVDTSALFKRYRTEPGTSVVLDLFAKQGRNGQILTSHFSILEAIGVLSRLRKGRVIRRSVFDRLAATILGDAGSEFRLVQVTSSMLSRAIELASVHALTAGDALQLASSMAVHDASPNLVFVSADEDLLTAASDQGLRVLSPLAPDAAARLTAFRQ